MSEMESRSNGIFRNRQKAKIMLRFIGYNSKFTFLKQLEKFLKDFKQDSDITSNAF